MLLIALTGSIATGKSTASSILSSPPHSLPLIDADLLAREVVLPGTRAYNLIVAHFSPSTPDLLLPAPSPPPAPSPTSPSHSPRKPQPRPLDRAALGRRVFGSSSSRRHDRAVLNSIIHPAVRLAMARAVLYYHLRGHWACLLDIPLLYESALDPFAGYVILIAAAPSTQLSRLRARDPHLSEGEAGDRIASQMGMGEKLGRTKARGEGMGTVVWNEGGREELEGMLGGTVEGLRRRGGWAWRWWLWGSPVGVIGVGSWVVWRGWMARRGWEGRRVEDGEAEGEKERGKEKEL